MRVQQVVLENNTKGFMLVDDDGLPVLPVLKYMKYLKVTKDNYNTQRTYCYQLKHYFTFLKASNKNYEDIKLEDLVEFIGWLRNPYPENITPLTPIKSALSVDSINLAITVVKKFYDFLYQNEQINKDLSSRLVVNFFDRGNARYKDFLHHINKSRPSQKNILTIPKSKKKLQVFQDGEIEKLLETSKNITDKFLLQLLIETGLRIGEALALFKEDFIFDHKKGHRIKLVDRGVLENDACLKTGEREIHISQTLMDLYDDYLYELHDSDSPFVFIKIKGKRKGKPLTYWDVDSLFKRLRKKTQIKANPHKFRHTHATIYYRHTKDIKQLQERLGHGQIQTTMNIYVHPSEEDIRDSWEKVKDVFNFGEHSKDKGV